MIGVAGRRRMSAALALVAVMLAAGCGGRSGVGQPGATPASKPSVPGGSAGSSSAGPCRDASLAGRQVAFPGSGGSTLAGFVLGTGGTAIVLVPQLRLTSCGFTAYARTLAARGYRVLAFDFAGEGDSTAGQDASNSGDVTAAITYLRQVSVEKIILIGTSRGGTAALLAASAVGPPVVGVISISGSRVFQSQDAEAAVRKLAVPALYITAEDDSAAADAARKLHAATPAGRSTLIVTPGNRHGIAFVGGTDAASVEANGAIDAFLTGYAPAA